MSLCALAFLVIDWVVRPAALKKLWWEDPSMHYLLKKPRHHHQIHYLFSISAGVIKTVKTGYLLHFKSKTFQYMNGAKGSNSVIFFPERLFGKAWREEFVVLYEDSSLIWFRDRDRNEPEGGILLKDAPEMLAAGQVNALAFLPFI